ncbi:MmgE/PrpD family protein [Verticiella sediminum]|uniref:MmgE/PrpD family protein n=1 Tax=Verticiella sediminum TaxID=1247510 RepID=A0A556AFA3_9BURK|nr:MmgE/PrpD family protein [Verticiella sediminum]TSH91559.1 MmgE/PrpD family protein [Verticiella sediminum]
MPLTQEIAAFCSALRHGDLPAAALPFIRTGFTDCFATLVAGRHSEPARILHATLDPPAGESRLFVDQGTARAPEAAWLNATAAHALDYDDAAQKGHLSVVLVPAILAEADACGADGKAMASAYAAGYETWAELLWREADLYHNHSWHPTGVLGPLAAAMACASLRGLDAERTAAALSIAASQSAGLIANFGSMTKPYHAGRAAHAGVLAARLAERGMTASPDALEHPKGLMQGLSPRGRVDVAAPARIGREWRLSRDGVNVKKYPTCFASHRAVDGMLALLGERDWPAERIARVVVSISRRNKSTLRFERPDDTMQAKFSMQFAMAAAALARRCSLLELTDDFVRRDDVRAFMARVQVEPLDEEDTARPGEAPQDIVEVWTVDGLHARRAVDYVRGGPELPLLPGELFDKFSSCLAAGSFAGDARPLFDALMAVDDAPDTRTLYEHMGR